MLNGTVAGGMLTPANLARRGRSIILGLSRRNVCVLACLLGTWTCGREALPDRLQTAEAASARLEFDRFVWEPSDGYGAIRTLALASDGRVAVADGQPQRIFVLEKSLDRADSLGRAGHGPGEFLMVGGMAFLSDGRLVARDAGSAALAVFFPDGRLAATRRGPVAELFGQESLLRVADDRILLGLRGKARGAFERYAFRYEHWDTTGAAAAHVTIPAGVAEECPVRWSAGDPPVRNG